MRQRERLAPFRQYPRVRDQRGRWRTGRLVPVSDLSDIPAEEWEPQRAVDAERRYREGILHDAIRVSVWPNGRRVLGDGNHRLSVARRLGVQAILVRFD